MYRKNTASQFVHFQGVDATTGGIKSGVTWTMRRCIDGTFAAGGGTVTEDSTNGWYKCALTQADTNGNNIAYNFTGTGAVPQTINIITTAADPTDAVHFGLTALPNTVCTTNASLLTSGTGTDQLSVTTGRIDVGKLLGTAWLTPGTAGTPDVNVKLWNALATVALPLVPTTAGRTLDVSVGGEAGLDWANVGSPTTALNLSGTTVNLCNTVTTVTNQLTASAIATGVWTDTTAGDFTTALSVGKSLMNGVSLGTGLTVASVSGAVGSVTGAVGSVTGAVGSVTGNVGGNVVGSVASVTGAVGSVTGNVGGNVTGTVASVVGAVGSVTGNVGGNVVGSCASVTGAVGSVTGAVGSVTGNVGGNVVGSVASVTGAVGSVTGLTASNLDTTISSRLASSAYVSPTTALTESYSTLHAAPTEAQLLFEIRSLLAEKSVTSTTLTAKKVDGSTSAMTFTLDSATSPTSITRAS